MAIAHCCHVSCRHGRGSYGQTERRRPMSSQPLPTIAAGSSGHDCSSYGWIEGWQPAGLWPSPAVSVGSFVHSCRHGRGSLQTGELRRMEDWNAGPRDGGSAPTACLSALAPSAGGSDKPSRTWPDSWHKDGDKPKAVPGAGSLSLSVDVIATQKGRQAKGGICSSASRPVWQR